MDIKILYNRVNGINKFTHLFIYTIEIWTTCIYGIPVLMFEGTHKKTFLSMNCSKIETIS